MQRRTFLAALASTAASALAQSLPRPTSSQTIDIHLDPSRTLGAIPENFIGLGYEISSVSTPGLLSAANHPYVQLVRTLGTKGVIRIGGNTSDYASFQPNGSAVSSPKASVITEANLRDLGTFLQATGWQLIWGLNLGNKTEEEAVSEAAAVSAIAGDKLLAFEIGNEPDLFSHESHRPTGYNYDQYLAEYRRYKQAVRAKLPNAPFAGPDAAGHTDWVTRFAQDEGSDLKLLTHHYYREGQNLFSTLDKLLNPDPHLKTLLTKLQQVSSAAHLPYRICETNSFSGGGRPGVSDTFGAALWVLDYMFTLASFNAAGVNIETGVNQLDFVSSYSPIGDDRHGSYTSKAPYYGMLAFTQAAQGERLALDYAPSGINLSAYATIRSGNATLTLINKDRSQSANIRLTSDASHRQARILRLTAPSLESKDEIRFGKTAVAPDGTWHPETNETAKLSNRERVIQVPTGSAAIVFLEA